MSLFPPPYLPLRGRYGFASHTHPPHLTTALRWPYVQRALSMAAKANRRNRASAGSSSSSSSFSVPSTPITPPFISDISAPFSSSPSNSFNRYNHDHETRLTVVEKDVSEIKSDVSGIRTSMDEQTRTLNMMANKISSSSKFGLTQIVVFIGGFITLGVTLIGFFATAILAVIYFIVNPIKDNQARFQEISATRMTEISQATTRVDDASIRRHEDLVRALQDHAGQAMHQGTSALFQKMFEKLNEVETQIKGIDNAANLRAEYTHMLLQQAWPKEYRPLDPLHFFPYTAPTVPGTHSSTYDSGAYR